MPTSLFQYEMLPTTWFYLSSLMIIAIFFKFNRFLSIRNLDLVGLVFITPGLLFLSMSRDKWGYVWLFAAGFILICRLLLDLIMVRRPLLEPNLNPSGITFAGILLLGFMLTNIGLNRGEAVQSVDTLRLEQILTIREWNQEGQDREESPPLKGKTRLKQSGFPPFFLLVDATNQVLAPQHSITRLIPASKEEEGNFPPESEKTLEGSPPLLMENPVLEKIDPLSFSIEIPVREETAVTPPEPQRRFWQELLAIGCVGMVQIAIALGLINIAHCHFNNIYTGVSAATLYFLLPYTNQMTGRLDHIVPAAFLVWAVAMYRRPVFSGICLGLASVFVYYPFFLVPLWCSFYWRRGMFRFLAGTAGIILLFYGLLAFSPRSLGSYSDQFLNMLGVNSFFMSAVDGFWNFYPTSYRIPVMAVFFIVCLGMLIWPARKNLATLLVCSAILLVGAQFWKGYQGGLFMAWYLPLLLLIFFRPNLEDRVASAMVKSLP
ncbi:MAG: hypothetical protein LBQ54_15205 [Planctomycetaceae bacterium]|nr:hypothetical protein [Planctomycetaceae bacterium]